MDNKLLLLFCCCCLFVYSSYLLVQLLKTKYILSTDPFPTYLVFLLTENPLNFKEILICKYCKALIIICFSTGGEKMLPILI